MDTIACAPGDRVLVRYGKNGSQESIFHFRALTPKSIFIFADEWTGIETFLGKAMVSEITRVPVVCPACRVEHQIARESLRCADCERDWASRQPAPQETCEDCGAQPAFYSPRSQVFACAQCQAKRGGLTGIGAEARVIHNVAICRTDDVDSDRHTWTRAKSAFVCVCGLKTFTKPKGA